jgi:putative membrane protein
MLFQIIIHLLVLSVVVFLVAEFLPGIRCEGYGSALKVAVVYSILNYLLSWILVLITLPFIILTLGLFLLVINTFLLWLADKLIEDFEIESLGTTFLAAVLITVINYVLRLFV